MGPHPASKMGTRSRPWAEVGVVAKFIPRIQLGPVADARRGAARTPGPVDAARRAGRRSQRRPDPAAAGEVLVAPDTRAARTRYRWQFDIAAPAAIRADEGLPPGLDVGRAYPVGHDTGPSHLGFVPPAHVTEFREY